MAIADELLALAGQLSTPAANDPEQAWLRRSISTSYYSVFHLLVQAAARQWTGSETTQLGLERSFKHEQMKEIARGITRGSWRGWSSPPLVMRPELRQVAESFYRLQEVRHFADYDNNRNWTQNDASDAWQAAQRAFTNWAVVKDSPLANEFLLSLMIGKKRE